MKITMIYDGLGITGTHFHYGMVFLFVGTAFCVFVYLWKKKRLDMDEEPKFIMMQDESSHKE